MNLNKGSEKNIKPVLPLKEAIKHVKDNSRGTFDESIEVHINFNLDVKKADQQVRTTTSLPHGTGKETKVAVMAAKEIKDADINLAEKDISKLEKGEISAGKDFDVLIVEPSYMPKIAKLGPILGPSGVMPNPKNGTIAEDAEQAVKQFKQGKIELRTEQLAPIMHLIIGKVSFDNKDLEENFMEVYKTIKSAKPQKAKPNWIRNIFLSSSMGKSVMVDLSSL